MVPLEPRHVYAWFHVLRAIVMRHDADGVGTHSVSMPWRRLLAVVGMLICLSGVAPRHTSTARVIRTALTLAAEHSGSLSMDTSRYSFGNYVYLIFSPRNHYVYIGETSTPGREHQHVLALRSPSRQSQRVHCVMAMTDPSWVCYLPMSFPPHVDRRALELALIRKFDPLGSHLLNTSGRRHHRRSTKISFLHKSVTAYTSGLPLGPSPCLSSPASQPSTHFFRPYRNLSLSRCPPVAPCRIPCVVLFAGGFGGTIEGLLKSGCYDVLLAVDYDLHVVRSLRRHFPTIPVLRYRLGGEPSAFADTLSRYVPRSRWHQLMIQASPPCTMLSLNRDSSVRDSRAAMALTRWSVRICRFLTVRYFWIEQVPASYFHLRHPHLFAAVHNLSRYVPQNRQRAVFANFPYDHLLSPPSLLPLPASSYLPHLPDGSRLRNRYGYSVPIDSPSVTVVGKPIYVLRPDGSKRSITPDEAKVLQGFPYSHDWSSHTSVRLAIQWYGDAVPPPFATAMGWALARYHLCQPVTWGPSSFFDPIPRDLRPCRPSLYGSLPMGSCSHSLDHILLALADSSRGPAILWCRPGVVDTTIPSNLLLYHGYAFAFFGPVLRRTGLTHALHALRSGHVNFLLVLGLRCSSPVSAQVINLFRAIKSLTVSAKRKIPSSIRALRYWDFYKLYEALDSVDAPPTFVATVRRKLTVLCKRIYSVPPRPRFRMSLLAAFGVSRESVQQLCFALVQPLDIPDVIKQFVLRSMTVSFTRTPSVGDKVCNFRKYCDSWDPGFPWPCTCSYLAATFGILDSPDSYAPVPSNGRHVHSRFDRCHGDHASILNSNLRDVFHPPSQQVARSLTVALRTFLLDVRRFSCSIRRFPLHLFPSLVSAPAASVSIPDDFVPVAQLCQRLGFRFTSRCASLCTSISRGESSFDSPLVPAADVNAFVAATNGTAVVSYLDKNPGLGCVVCPFLFWHTLRDAFWTNPDYKRSPHNAVSLLAHHRSAYASGGWDCLGPFEPRSPPGHVPFIFGKDKSNLKNRPVLSAFRHCLKKVYHRAALALRVCLLTVVLNRSWDANVSTTFDAPRLISRDVNRAVDELILHDRISPFDVGIDAYAGDVSSMFDKLPCATVMRAVAWLLDQASSISSVYNLRSTTRRFVTINLRDPSGHRIGVSYQGEGIHTVSFAILTDICSHYCFDTFFLFCDVFFQLQLGVPQGGSLSDPLSKTFCIFCEHQWLSSLFDLQRFSCSGAICSSNMTPAGRSYFASACGFPLLADDDSPLAFVVLKRYADDCRAVVCYSKCSPSGAAVASAFIDAYRSDCYVRPCSLDDEERGGSFHFMQGYYTFSPYCTVAYVVKNALPLLSTSRRRLRALQHFTSYGQQPSRLRYATVMGKFTEIDAISSDVPQLLRAIFLQCVELALLGFPMSVIRRAMRTKHRRTGSTVWCDAIPVATAVMAACRSYFSAHHRQS